MILAGAIGLSAALLVVGGAFLLHIVLRLTGDFDARPAAAFSVAVLCSGIVIASRPVFDANAAIALWLVFFFGLVGSVSVSVQMRSAVPLWLLASGAVPIIVVGLVSFSVYPVVDGIAVALPFALAAYVGRSKGLMVRETVIAFVIGCFLGIGFGLLVATAGSALTLAAFRRGGRPLDALPFVPAMCGFSIFAVFASVLFFR